MNTQNFQNESPIIKVIGVGGGGSNAINHMFQLGINGVDFVVTNTDKQALYNSPVPNKIQLGSALTEGQGAGANPEVGKNAALESIDTIKECLMHSTKMVFITAGLGGGTGTGAAPVIASVAKELGILTIGIVTIPFSFEGKKRKELAEKGIEEMKKHVDSLIIICNDKLREVYGTLKVSECFAQANNVLATAAKSIAEIISLHMLINVDFNDVKTVMKNSGVAIMGNATASGERRHLRAVENALVSPLLNDSDISGAKYILINITSGIDDVGMDEFGEITDYLQETVGGEAEIITGYGMDTSLGDKVSVTIIATGFLTKQKLYTPPQNISVVNLDAPIQAIKQPLPINQSTNLDPFVAIIPQEASTVVISKETKDTAIHTLFSLDEETESIENTDLITNQFEYTEDTTNETELLDTHDTLIVSNLNEASNDTFEFVDMPSQLQENKQDFFEKEPLIEPQIVRQNSIETNLINQSHQIKLAKERLEKMKELANKTQSSDGLNDLESVPAYIRNQKEIHHQTPSKETEASTFNMSINSLNNIEIKPNTGGFLNKHLPD